MHSLASYFIIYGATSTAASLTQLSSSEGPLVFFYQIEGVSFWILDRAFALFVTFNVISLTTGSIVFKFYNSSLHF